MFGQMHRLILSSWILYDGEMRGRNIMRATEATSLIDENEKDSGDEKLMTQIVKKQLLNE